MKNTKLKYKLNFKTMKKGLLTLLAASLVFVGCQNYDDQFDDLNAQISALKSQVDGLSSLSGQVSSLSGTISGLQSGITAAQNAASAANTAASAIDLSGLSASLAALQAEVDAIEAAIATTATAAEVAALQTSLTAVETDLADLLVSNNVYSTAIAITDAASMASALALGNKVALMNASVTITDAATVADADIQTFINRIKTMNASFSYNSGSATGAAPTFDEMVSAKQLIITQAGDISFKGLTGATEININDAYESKITSVDFGALTSLTAFTNDDAAANTINLTNATNIDLASLTRHTSSSASPFTITMKKGGTLDVTALDDVSTAGAQEDLYMNLNGPASFTKTNIADGDIGLTNVATASVSNFFGTLDVDSGVETLTVVDGVNLDLAGSSDLTTATLDFAYDYDPALSTANAAIAAAGYSSTYTQDLDDGDIDFSDLETLTVTGKLMDLYVDGTELVTLSIDATMHDLQINGATDLTTLTVASGSKIGNITLTGTTNLAVADFNHTSNLTDTDSTAEKSVDMSVTNNTALTKLHSTGDDVDNLTITGNTLLAELDFTGLADDGAETSALAGGVTIWGNALVATAANNTADADTATSTTGADGGTADAGNFDDGSSGMDTLKTYLTHIAATSGSTAFVTFDNVLTETDTETTGVSTVQLNVADAGDGSTTNEATVLKMTAAVAAAASNAVSATKGKRAFAVTASGKVGFTVNSVSVPATVYTMTGNGAVDALNIASAANKDLAAAAGLTMNALHVYASETTVVLNSYANNASATVDEKYTDASVTSASTDTGDLWTVGIEDEFTLTVGGNSVTTTPGGHSGNATTLAGLEAAFMAAWAAKYGAAGTASTSAIATIVNDAGNTAGTFIVRALQKDSGGHGLAVSVGVTDKTQASGQTTRTSGNIGYKIGSTTSSSDNSTVATATAGGVLITFESTLEGVSDSVLTGMTSDVTTASVASLTELTTNYAASTGVTTYALAQDPRTDVVNVVAAVANTASTGTAATLFNRVTWLG